VAELLLRLYVSGNSTSSRRAQENLARLRDTALPRGWEVKVIDVLTEPHLAEEAKILATPTLSYEHPFRPRRIIGDLSDTQKVLDFLGIAAKGDRL
jgi:circadian clock protein KaiB